MPDSLVRDDDIHPPGRRNPLAGSPLERVFPRDDPEWVAARLASAEARFVPVWRGRNLLRAGPDGAAPVLLGAASVLPHLATSPWALLGLAPAPIFAIDLSAWDDPLPEMEEARFEDLWRVGTTLAPDDAALLAHARGLMHWRTRHRFCGVCGGRAVAEQAGHVLRCQGCGATHFPRTDPAVIMLVTHGGLALLGQPTRLRARRIFTTLAGFVEPGESLEEAVAREVREETGVRVRSVFYHSSQPWPFPASLMLGFRAEALDAALTIDPGEIAEARWFSRREARAEDGFSLPPPLSIARRLIEDWLAEE